MGFEERTEFEWESKVDIVGHGEERQISERGQQSGGRMISSSDMGDLNLGFFVLFHNLVVVHQGNYIYSVTISSSNFWE